MPSLDAPRFIAIGCCGTVVVATPVLDPATCRLVEIATGHVALAPRTPPSWLARVFHLAPRIGTAEQSRAS